ncbi:transcriptional regulator [Niabella insulamsoli]|uniref:transcriptional regulator n=1 Tax=Niabella insulamsoli TaxID=3144874 RepID=UPI0031FC2379
MKINWTLFFILLLGCVNSFGQKKDIQPYINAWEKPGKDQSYAAQVFFDSLRINKNNPEKVKKYKSDIEQLKAYLAKNNDRRLQVRLMMFEIIVGREFGNVAQFYKTIDDAVRIAYPLQDAQLNAELYSIRADVPPSLETHLLYNLKALDIQRKIGFKYFPYMPNRFFGVSASLFGQQDFKQAIAYGREFFKVWDLDTIHRDPRVYIFQCDLLGTAYRKLHRYDSSRWYYKEILNRLKEEADPFIGQLWTGIALGNLGKIHLLTGAYGQALPLLQTYLQSSYATGDSLNIAMANNAFASLFFAQKNYPEAYRTAGAALDIAERHGFHTEIIKAADILGAVKAIRNETDSAIFYNQLSFDYQMALRDSSKKSELSVVKAQIAFDNLQHSFNLASASAQREKALRNTILAVIVLVTIIALLLYSKKQVRDKNRLQELQLRQAAAEQKVIAAREKMALFTKNIVDQNKLIHSLQQKLSGLQQSSSATPEELLPQPLLTEDDWETFKMEFSKAYPQFFDALRQRSTGLTPAMERLSALIFLQLNNYQIANSLGISKDSVSRSKRRLRAVLQLDGDASLETYILSIGSCDQ